MDGENHGQLFLNFGDGVHETAQRERIVDIGGAMECEDRISPRRQMQFLQDGRALGAIAITEQRINHEVADEEYLAGGDAFMG